MLGLSSNGYDGTGFFGTARAFTEATQTHTNAAHGTRWVFSTNPDGSTTITDTFRLPQDGGIQILTGTKPTCDSTKRGYIFFVAGGAGVADTYEACDKDDADVYAWRDIHASGGGGGSNTDFSDLSSFTKRSLYAQNHGTATTMVIHNLCDNGLSVVGTAAAVKNADGSYVRQTCTAAINNRASFICGQDQTRTDWEGRYYSKVRTGGSITNVRIFAGLESTDITDVGDSAPQAHYAMFRYATDVDGTAFWRTMTNDNGVTPTVTTTTAAIATESAYVLLIVWNAAADEIKFYVDGTLVATHTTDLPTSSTPLGPVVSLKTLDGDAKQIHWGWANLWNR